MPDEKLSKEIIAHGKVAYQNQVQRFYAAAPDKIKFWQEI